MKLGILSFWLLVYLPCFGQNLPTFVKSTEANAEYYINFNNLIQVKLNGASPSDIDVKAKAGMVTRKDDSSFVFRSFEPIEELKMKLYFKGLPVDILTSKVDNFPKVKITIAGIETSTVKQSELRKFSNFQIDNAYLAKLNVELFAYTISLLGGADVEFFNVHQGNLQEHILNKIRSLSEGRQILISNIMLRSKLDNSIIQVETEPSAYTVIQG